MQNDFEAKKQADFSDLVTFNESLRLIHRSGLPTRIFHGRYDDAFLQDLERTESTVARRIGLGESLELILQSDGVSPRYAAAFQNWLLQAPPEVTFGHLVQEPLASEDERIAWALAFRRLCLLLVVGSLVLGIHHFRTRPLWIAFYESVALDDAGLGLRNPISPLLIALIVLGVALAWAARRAGKYTSLIQPAKVPWLIRNRWVNSESHEISASERKEVAKTYQTLVQIGVPNQMALEDSIRLVTNQKQTVLKPDGLLAWSSAPFDPSVESHSESRLQRIGLVAKVFDRLGNQKSSSRSWVPHLMESVIGGVIVLLAGYQLLGPYVRLVEALM